MMTRRDYEALARIICAMREDYDAPALEAVWLSMASKIVAHFAHDNPRFDRSRFLKACGFLETIRNR